MLYSVFGPGRTVFASVRPEPGPVFQNMFLPIVSVITARSEGVNLVLEFVAVIHFITSGSLT